MPSDPKHPNGANGAHPEYGSDRPAAPENQPKAPIPEWAKATEAKRQEKRAAAEQPEGKASDAAQHPSWWPAPEAVDRWLDGREPENPAFADGVQEIWESTDDPRERLGWAMAVLDRYPDNEWCSAVWIRLRFHEQSGDPDAPPGLPEPALAEQLYRYYADRMLPDFEPDEEEAERKRKLHQAEVLERSLYVDLFEDEDLGMAAWTWFHLQSDLPEALWSILLRNSGPIPWPLKHAILIRRAEDKKQHLDVYLAIRHALFDPEGAVSEEDAALILAGLDLDAQMHRIENPDGFPSYAEVQERLAGLF